MPKAPLIYQPKSCFNTPKLVQFDKLNLASKIFNHATREFYILWDNLFFFKTQFLLLRVLLYAADGLILLGGITNVSYLQSACTAIVCC
jgi:hypothetical protein